MKDEGLGVDRISRVFRKGGRAALMPYFTIGYPDYETSLDVIAACCKAGADLMELGVPFSDPLADGPTIQRSTQIALEGGITVSRCLQAVRELRGHGVETPFLLMGYINPVLSYGLERFAREAAEAGVDGFIVPDLPPDEAGTFSAHCTGHGLGLVFLVAPNSTPERITLVVERSNPFVYLVSLTGVTGGRTSLPANLATFIDNVATFNPEGKPLAVGFGIATGEQAAAVGKVADGVIVGSALIDAVARAVDAGESPAEAAGRFVGELKHAILF
ncbi:MAG TPA: tryptophan synthase subunit alpha [Anaerolineales bacterium]|nr:tryptophan synthase subunit alpha [Anaerolineales bacterium]